MAAASPCSTYFAATSSYMNPEDHVRHALDFSARHGLHPDFAIYEPGFLRGGAALARVAGSKTLSQAVNTPGNEPVCPEPSELDVSGGAGPQASVLRL
jgi:hypothetical protein